MTSSKRASWSRVENTASGVEDEVSVPWLPLDLNVYLPAILLWMSVAWIRLRCNLRAQERFLNCPSEVSFADRIDDRVTY